MKKLSLLVVIFTGLFYGLFFIATGRGDVTISAGPGSHQNLYTVNTTLSATDCGNVPTMNGSSLTFSLASTPPSVTCPFWVQNLAATALTISRNGTLINGGTSNITLNQYSTVRMWTDGANYFSDLPLIAGSNITLTPAVNGMTIAATTSGQPIFPNSPGATPTTNGNANYDTTNNIPVIGVNGITATMLTSDPLHYLWDVDYFSANGAGGTHAWSVQGGTGVLGFASGPSANYPMGSRFSSGAGNGNFGLFDYTGGTATLTTGNLVAGDFYYFFKLEQNAAAAQQSLRVGFFSASAAGDTSNEIVLRVVETTANNNDFFFVCRAAAAPGVDGTATDTGIPADTATHKFRIHFNSATSYTMWLDTFTGAGTTVNTGCPGSFSAFDGFKIDTSENVTKFVDVWKWAHGQIVAD